MLRMYAHMCVPAYGICFHTYACTCTHASYQLFVCTIRVTALMYCLSPSLLHLLYILSYHITPIQVDPMGLLGYLMLYNKDHHFLTVGLALTTRSSTGRQKYSHFCTTAKIPLTPAMESTLLLFTSHLPTVNISHATIKVYLLAIATCTS